MFTWTCVLFRTVSEIEPFDCIVVWLGRPVLSFPPALLRHCLKHVNLCEASVGCCDCWRWCTNCHLNNKYRYYKPYVLVISLSYQQFCGLQSNGSISETVQNRTCSYKVFFLFRMTDTMTSRNNDPFLLGHPVYTRTKALTRARTHTHIYLSLYIIYPTRV
jgi:hypothetical protein